MADARFQLIKGRMRAPDPGETNACICDKDVEQPRTRIAGTALMLISYNLSHGVHSDKLSHNVHSSLLINKTREIPLLLLCTTKLFFVKYSNRVGQGK